MFKVLGIDPGIKRTAFAVLGENGPERLHDFSLAIHRDNEVAQLGARMGRLFEELDLILKQEKEVTVIGIEKTDWHQNVSSPTFNYRKERLTQAAMASFQVMLTTYCIGAKERVGRELKLHFVGANAWKLQFGASTKEGVMEQCHVRYQDRIRWNRDTREYFWFRDGHVLKDHETDAIALAEVLFNTIQHPELANFTPAPHPRRGGRRGYKHAGKSRAR